MKLSRSELQTRLENMKMFHALRGSIWELVVATKQEGNPQLHEQLKEAGNQMQQMMDRLSQDIEDSTQ